MNLECTDWREIHKTSGNSLGEEWKGFEKRLKIQDMAEQEAEVWSDDNQSGSSSLGKKKVIKYWKAGQRALMSHWS